MSLLEELLLCLPTGVRSIIADYAQPAIHFEGSISFQGESKEDVGRLRVELIGGRWRLVLSHFNLHEFNFESNWGLTLRDWVAVMRPAGAPSTGLRCCAV